MTNTHRTFMLKLLTVLIFLGHMTLWRLYWGWGSGMASSMEWLCGTLYGAGSTALMWGALLILDGYHRKHKLGKYS